MLIVIVLGRKERSRGWAYLVTHSGQLFVLLLVWNTIAFEVLAFLQVAHAPRLHQASNLVLLARSDGSQNEEYLVTWSRLQS